MAFESNINKNHPLKFSIITPSYNMLPYLKLCAASIERQEYPHRQHIVMDATSADGTTEWLSRQTGLVFFSEKDKGMYDAINKGFLRADGEILSFLNCDEQYLPGALTHVSQYFEDHPETDILFGDMLLTRPNGELIAYRKSYQPRSAYIKASFLYVPTCAMFMRRRILDSGVIFNINYAANSDAEYVCRVLDKGFKAAHTRYYLSSFAITGSNMSASAIAGEESERLLSSAPAWIRKGRTIINLLRLAEKYISGAYFQKKPLRYSLLIIENNKIQEKSFCVSQPSYKWRWS